jgi:spore germination protein KA
MGDKMNSNIFQAINHFAGKHPYMDGLMVFTTHVSFPAVVEAFLMEFTFGLLREAGARMPRAVGQTLSIVGALVIVQPAVIA